MPTSPAQPATTLLHDLLAPPALAFRPGDLTLGDQMGKVLVLQGYPPRVGPAWAARVLSLPGVFGSLHAHPADTYTLLKAMNTSIAEFASRLNNGGPALAMQQAQQSLDDARELLRKIDAESQRVFYVTIVLLVLAPDQEELGRRVRTVQAACAAASMHAREAVFQQEPGLRAAGPWGDLPSGIADLGRRNMPAETVAAAYPWTASGMNHGHGTVWGRDTAGGMVLLDRWAPPPEAGITNPNVAILATSGAGKTGTATIQIVREYAQGAKVIVIDPERQFRRLCQRLGGSWVNTAGGSGRLNPFQARALPPALGDDDDEDAAEEAARGALDAHMQRLQTFFSLYLPDLSLAQRARLEEAIEGVYAEKGIDRRSDPATVKTWPTTTDLYRYVKANGPEDLALLLRSAGEGSDSAMWAGQTTLAADPDFLVLDIHELAESSDRVRRAQFFNCLSYAWDLVRRDRTERVMLFVDEAWMLVDPQTPQALLFMKTMAKRIRKYSGSLNLATQNTADFFAPEVKAAGEAVIGNCAYKLLLRQDDKDLEVLDKLMHLTEAEHDLLHTAKRSEGLLIAGNQRIHVVIEAAPWELDLIP